jgi:hypothetical protein
MMFPKPTHKRRKPEPVVKIKLQAEKECYNCSTTQSLERHHCLHGRGIRQKADRYNLIVWLCSDCHRGNKGVHNSFELDLKLKRLAQVEFEKVYDRTKWMNIFQRNYL